FGSNSSFPTIKTDFNLDWNFAGEGVKGGELKVALNNAQLNLGQFISKFLKQAQQVLRPVKPLIDAIQKDIPILQEMQLQQFERTPPPGIQIADIISY